MGPESGLRLQVLDDDLTTPAGQALVRVIQASLKDQVVKVTYGSQVLASSLSFANVTSYIAVSPGTETVAATAGGGDVSTTVTLAAGTVHTLVVLDGANGLEIDNLTDAVGSGEPPVGPAQTGFGGTAAHGPGSALPWLGLIGVGLVLALAGAMTGRRRPQPRHGF
jgi:hypothetical protein